MKLSGLNIGQEIIVQMIWGEQRIEFFSYIIEANDMSIVVTPYLHNNSPLELNIDNKGKVICNIFADSPEDKQRISWRNVELKTLHKNDGIVYQISTSSFNQMSAQDDRRGHERMEVNKRGKVVDPKSALFSEVVIRDVSDIGISFVVPKEFEFSSHQAIVVFDDTINEKSFSMRIECTLVRSKETEEGIFWGCKLAVENKDYLLYCFMQRLINKTKLKHVEIDSV